jgi:hypothetical protein
MSKEHISSTVQPINIYNFFRERVCCIICNTALDIHAKEHKCVLRPQDADIIIHNKNTVKNTIKIQ